MTHYNTGEGWPQSAQEVRAAPDEVLDAFMGMCGVEPADEKICLACLAYMVYQERHTPSVRIGDKRYDVLVELEERLINAGKTLHKLEVEIAPSSRADIERKDHLSSKREGVNLALSYIHDMKRGTYEP